MTLKTYQAYTMAEALAAVKQDLGANSVILNTRSFRRGGILGIGGRTIFEVTATTAQQASGRGALLTQGTVAQKARTTRTVPFRKPRAAAHSEHAGVPLASIKPSYAVSEKVEQMYAELIAGAPRPGPLRLDESGEYKLENNEPNAPATDGAESRPARRYVLKVADAANGQPAPVTANSSPHIEVKPESVVRSPERNRMNEELSAIRDMVGRVIQQQIDAHGGPITGMPKQLFEMYLRMVSQDLSEELAEQIVGAVKSGLTDDELDDPATVHDAVLHQLAEFIPVSPEPMPLERPADRPIVIALVGPTGVGKTTTVAKLAAAYKLKHNRKVALVTADTYRIAAVEQLRTYADIIGVPLEVVLAPADMDDAFVRQRDADVILIDTAGRGQKNASRIDELRRFLDAAEPDEVHLVLASTAGEKVLFSEAEAFAPLGVDKVVLTKLDEAVSFGMIVSVVRRIEKELSFLTTGQEVPDHIEPGRPERLARLILGDDSVS